LNDDLKEKLDLINQQIEDQRDLYRQLSEQEAGYKEMWHYTTCDREQEIFDKIHELQSEKTRLIHGEKLPDIIYVDKEIPKYVDRRVEYININKSPLTVSLLWFIIIILASVGLFIYLNWIDVIIKLNF
jgi:hypothetical protein